MLNLCQRPGVLETKAGGICVSTVGIVCKCCYSFWDPSKVGVIAVRTASSVDDADGADAIRGTCADPDHSRPYPAFARERDFDAQRAQERLRSSKSAGECARVFGPGATGVIASTVCA